MISHPPFTGIILAGGRSSRMGGKDKGLIPFSGKALYQHAIERLAPQTNTLIISANRHMPEYQSSGLPVFNDSIEDYPGPLAGILTGLEAMDTEWALCVPCDTPFFPLDLGEKLWLNRKGQNIAFAHDGERAHPTLVLIHKSTKTALRDYLARGERKLMLFFELLGAQSVNFSENKNAFRNLNTPEECQMWESEVRGDQ